MLLHVTIRMHNMLCTHVHMCSPMPCIINNIIISTLQRSFSSNIRSNNSTCDAGRYLAVDKDLRVETSLHHMLNYCYVCCSKMTFAVYSEHSMSLYKINKYTTIYSGIHSLSISRSSALLGLLHILSCLIHSTPHSVCGLSCACARRPKSLQLTSKESFYLSD